MASQPSSSAAAAAAAAGRKKVLLKVSEKKRDSDLIDLWQAAKVISVMGLCFDSRISSRNLHFIA